MDDRQRGGCLARALDTLSVNRRLSCAFLLATLLLALPATAQVGLAGAWTGAIMIGQDSFDMTFTLVVEDGAYQASLSSNQLRIYGLPAEQVTVQGNRLTVRLDQIGAEYRGRLKFDAAGNTVTVIDGDFFQEGELLPLTLRPAED